MGGTTEVSGEPLETDRETAKTGGWTPGTKQGGCGNGPGRRGSEQVTRGNEQGPAKEHT